MMNNTGQRVITATALIGLTALLIAGCAETSSLAREHPVAVAKPPVCSDCHTDWRASLSHTSDFTTRHRFYASQRRPVCGLCHREAFCAD